MKIKEIKKRKAAISDKVMLTSVGSGFLQGDSGSLPDVDNDFQSDKRQLIKKYYEDRYNLNGRERVFSAGTTTTLKIKQVIKDVAKLHGVPHVIVNTITKAIPDDSLSWSGFMKYAFEEKITSGARKRILRFIEEYPEIIDEVRFIMGQPKAYSIHASALIITPDKRDSEDVDCYDFLPIKRMDDGSLVSEFDGYSIDDIGLLKNDVLATKELTKIHDMCAIIKREYGDDINIANIASSNMDDPKAYEVVANGHTQEVFQFSGSGMTKFVQEMQPTRFEDFIAGTSLFRPASLESGSAETYNDCKKGLIEPVYLWGTHDILKETYGVLAYQEQLAQMSREIGGFSISEGVRLVKLISKKKTDKIHEMKDKFMTGASIKGCPREDAVKIWEMIESGGSYLFNKCISGKEAIILSDSSSFNIKRLFNLYSIPNADKLSALSIDTNTLDVHSNIIKDVRYMGERELYRITLASGSHFDATDNHKHPTHRGEVQTKHLTLGDSLFIYNNDEILSSEVKSVEFVGYDEVYDIEMEAPYHNFIVDSRKGGIVTCNSHATAYSVISYIGAYIKANYPTVFYTVALEMAGKDDIPSLISEMAQASDAKIVAPAINVSSNRFFSDYKKNNIYWSISRINQCGEAATASIMKNKELFGDFKNLEDFIQRMNIKKHIDDQIFNLAKNKDSVFVFGVEYETGMKARKFLEEQDYLTKFDAIIEEDLNEEQAEFIKSIGEKGYRNPIDSRVIKNLIFAGCFDELEGCTAVTDRLGLMKRASELMGFEMDEETFPPELINKHYFWSGNQVNVSGIGFVDYRRVYDNSPQKPKLKTKGRYVDIIDIEDLENDGKKAIVCATISDITFKKYTDKKTGELKNYAYIGLSQNKSSTILTLWHDTLEKEGDIFNVSNVGKILLCNCAIKWDDYHKKNKLMSQFSSNFYII